MNPKGEIETSETDTEATVHPLGLIRRHLEQTGEQRCKFTAAISKVKKTYVGDVKLNKKLVKEHGLAHGVEWRDSGDGGWVALSRGRSEDTAPVPAAPATAAPPTASEPTERAAAKSKPTRKSRGALAPAAGPASRTVDRPRSGVTFEAVAAGGRRRPDDDGDGAPSELDQLDRYLYDKVDPLYRDDAALVGLSGFVAEGGGVTYQGGVLGAAHGDQVRELLYLNVSEPLCLVCVGLPGAGKSNTMNVVLENCLCEYPFPPEKPTSRPPPAMCGLVLHYDKSESSLCEATGLPHRSDHLPIMQGVQPRGVDKLAILVSPTFYKQRKDFYDDGVNVIPLLFSWSSLSASQLKKLMRLQEDGTQLYVSVMMDLLRQYQSDDKLPEFQYFLEEVKSQCKDKGQLNPLDQRLRLLESFVKESARNVGLRDFQKDLSELMEPGMLIVCDLTDELLLADEASGMFQVVLEQFRRELLPSCGKVVAFDEAHKYLSGKDELSSLIVDTVRNMRHEGIRVLVSTQSPIDLPSELLELTTVTVVHQFQSASWFNYLSTKIPLPPDSFRDIRRLGTGEALVASTKMSAALPPDTVDDAQDPTCVRLKIRRRITRDFGNSRRTTDKL